jgi:tRNA nucleotidyltransferase (CCA-adding enzyme)
MGHEHDIQATIWQQTGELRELMSEAGWQWRLVGGAVRDLTQGTYPHEYDFEVVGVALREIVERCSTYAAHIVGSDKPIIRLRLNGIPIDISVTPHADIADAAAQRDVTINALALLPDGTLIDPYGGVADLKAGLLRHINAGFLVDPVRVLRLMRLAATYQLTVAPATAQFVRHALPTLPPLDSDRIWHEWRLWALAPHPAAGLTVLVQTDVINLYPELGALMGCPQDPTYHPEGDVWVHTGYVCAAAAAANTDLDAEHRITLLLAALCHDLGKPATTAWREERIVSPGHALAGVEPTQMLLERIHAPKRYHDPICNLVREHMVAINAIVSDRSVRRLAQRLAPADIELWERLTAADSAGRPPLPPQRPGADFVARARMLHVHRGRPTAVVRGDDVIALGIPPGPQVRSVLMAAYEAQLDGLFDTHAAGMRWLHVYLATLKGDLTS